MHEQDEVERLRAEAQARLAAIIESSDDAIVSKTLDGVILTWNSGAERIFGWTAAEVIGKPITILIPTDRLEEEPAILGRIRNGERVDHFETVRQTKDGKLIHVSVTISPIRNSSGRIIAVSKVARDVTLQKQFQQGLQAAKEAAEAASRAKDDFLSVLSHELRTPLTPVLAAIGLLERNKALSPEVAAELAMMRRNVETEARLVDDLLDLTRIAQGKTELHHEVVDVHAVVHSILRIVQQQVEEKGLAIALALRAKKFQVWADPGRLQQMLLNLLGNAVKFTPDDGAISIRTSNENGTIKIDIIDTGIGIEPDVLPRLFRPFEQGEQSVTRKFGGLGLGLSIVKSLVEMHNASIQVQSEGKNKGSSFTLRLNTVSPTDAAVDSGAADDDLPRKGYRVLLVEDHADTRNILSRLLKAMNCQVTATSSVKEAIEAAEHHTFDLLLSDIGLPDGSGMEVMKHLAARSSTRGIAISGFGQDEDVRKSREAGFAAHLTKPVNFKVLQSAIQNVSA